MTQELLQYKAGKSESDCPHKLTEDKSKELLELMPFSKVALERLPKDVLQSLLWYKGHDTSYSNHFTPRRNGCYFQVPYDQRIGYSGETAPYCGHAYTGTVSEFISYVKQVEVAEWEKKEYDHTDYHVPIVRRFVIASVILGTHIPEVYDHMDVVEPQAIDRHFYEFIEFEHPMDKEKYWELESIQVKRFDQLNDFSPLEQ